MIATINYMERIKLNKKVYAFLWRILVVCSVILCLNFVLNVSKSKFSATEGKNVLQIQTYLDAENQSTHPSVIDIGKKWNGYRYWMAYSPYPYADGGEENPCIAVSNDMINWTIPNGLYNPIADNEETACDELKDPHIVFNSDKNELEVWYLGRINSTIANNGDLMLFRKTSEDGIHWSEYEVMKIMNGTLSPSIIYERGKYKIWSILPSDDNNGAILYSESVDGKFWNEYETCTFEPSKSLENIWHGSVSYCDGVYYLTYISNEDNLNSIYYSESDNGLQWSTQVAIITKGNYWRNYYRPFLLKSDNIFYCIYGVITSDNEWYLSMSYGENIANLQGISSTSDESIYSVKSEALIQCEKIYANVKTYCNVQVIVISVLTSLIGIWVIRNGLKSFVWLAAWLLCCVRYYNTWIYNGIIGNCVLILVTGMISFLIVEAFNSITNMK